MVNTSGKNDNIMNITDLQHKASQERDNSPSFDYDLRNPDVQEVGDDTIKYVFEKDGKMKFLIVGKMIKIISISKNIETLEIKYDVKIYTFDGREIPIEGLNRKSIHDKVALLELSAYGSEINAANAKFYVKSLENQERFIKVSNFHEKIGWGMYEGVKIFKHQQAVGMPYKHTSSYKGQLDISKAGTLDEYKSFIEEEVTGQTQLEAAIAIGVSAVVAGFIGEQIGVTSQIFHIYGNSSTGKTTVGELIISTAAKPSLQNNGLMYSWSATQNALIGNIRNNFGLPILFDDSSVSRIKNFSSLLYQLVQGRDKDRMTKEAEMRASETWRTSIISTGESSLLSESNQNEGLRVRVTEIDNIQWTRNAAHSERIKRKVAIHHGHAAEIVAEGLIELGEDKVLELVEESKKKRKEYLISKDKFNRLHDRILNSMATVEIGITILEEKLKLGFDIENVMEFMLDQTLMDDRSIADKAYEDILEYVASNSNKFNQDVYIIDQDNKPGNIFKKKPEDRYGKSDNIVNLNQKLLGKIEDVSIEEISGEKGSKTIVVEREISIPVKIFSGILKELGYNNSAGILKDFKEKGLLCHDKDRNTRKRKISEKSSTIAVNVIKVKEAVEIVAEKEIDKKQLYSHQELEKGDGEIDF